MPKVTLGDNKAEKGTTTLPECYRAECDRNVFQQKT